MSTEPKPSPQEYALAEIELAQHRLDAYRSRLAKAPGSGWSELEQRLKDLANRADALAARVEGATRVTAAAKAAVEDLGAGVDTLEADLDVVASTEDGSYRVAVDRQLRMWRTRAEQLRLQTALATMEARDDLEVAGQRLSRARGAVVVELRRAVADAREVALDVREDLEHVLVDVRRAVERAADALSNSDHD